jgi:hypothetical protein
MIKNPSNPGILTRKYFGKLFLSCTLMAVLILVQSGMAFASGSVPDGLNVVQQRVVSGVVTDRDGNALPSVSILEKGTTNGVLSDTGGSRRYP